LIWVAIPAASNGAMLGYCHVLYPLHQLVFTGMLRGIVPAAEK